MITTLITITTILAVQLNVLAGIFIYQKYSEIKSLKEIEEQRSPTLQDLLSNM